VSASAPLRIAVLVSGGGRSLENLASLIRSNDLAAQIVLVVSNTPKAFALERASRLGLERLVIPHQQHATPEAFSAAVFAALASAKVELVVLAGFLRLLLIPPAWLGRVINIHPSLLPAFGGKGFFGERVHQAVLERGVQFTGCTVHYVTNEYDCGPILVQRCIEVRADDDAHSLAERVFEEEKLALPEAIRLHAGGKVRFENGRAVRAR
jgi:phosphoribosylglycinamide formyltransferase-1